MGAFSEAASALARYRIPVIPTYPARPSQPMVKRPDKFGVRASLRLLTNERYINANAGLIAGRRSQITALDLDTSDSVAFAELERGAGPSPIVVRSPSGGFHVFYRYAGERRRIRPFGTDGLPLDVIGDGLLVLPPSLRPATEKKRAGCYEIVQGGWADLERLPPIRDGFLPSVAGAAIRNDHARPLTDLKDGDGRNNTLFRIARSVAQQFNNFDEFQIEVLAINSKMAEPLPVDEALRIVVSVWRYKEGGRLIAPGSRVSMTVQEDFDRIKYIPAFYLLVFLRLHHPLDHVFAIVPEALANKLEMSKDTIRAAREYLVGAGYLTLMARGGLQGGSKMPNQYRLSTPKS